MPAGFARQTITRDFERPNTSYINKALEQWIRRINYEGNSQNVVERNVSGNVVIFRNKVDIFLTANASVKPKDQQGLKKRKKIMPYNLTYNFKWLFMGI